MNNLDWDLIGKIILTLLICIVLGIGYFDRIKKASKIGTPTPRTFKDLGFLFFIGLFICVAAVFIAWIVVSAKKI